MQLRFTSFVMTNLRRDFHPQEHAHAGRTKNIKPNRQAALDLHREAILPVPTGILINSIKMSGLSEVDVSGTIWQRIPTISLGISVKEGVRLPFAVKSSMEEAYRSEVGNATVIGWNFSATLPQHFDSTLYPFERLQIKITLKQKNTQDKVQLVPDFSSYDVYAPSSNPFVAKDSFIPGWLIKQTYFTLLSGNHSTTFGYSNKVLTEYTKDLSLNITIQRKIMTNFLSTFLPIFMLSTIAYIALLITSGDEMKISIFAFKPSNMQAVAASFLLFIVFSMLNIRNQIISDNVLYVEYMYFFMYFVVFWLVVASTKIAMKEENSIFCYHDGHIVKTLYWPMVSGSMFLITAIVFLLNS